MIYISQNENEIIFDLSKLMKSEMNILPKPFEYEQYTCTHV